jgi:hypothetical protein
MPEGRAARRGAWPWLLVIAWALLALAFSSIPDVGERLPGALRFPGSDLIAHFAMYAVFGALLANATGRWWPAVLIASAFGALDELYQGTVPGRFPSALDWLADTVGGAVGAAAMLFFSRRKRPSG